MSYLRPAGVQNSDFKLGDVGSMIILNEGPNPTNNVESNMQDLYSLVDTGNLSSTAPLSSTSSNLTIQWFFGRDSNGNTNYRPYYYSNSGQSSALTFSFIYGGNNRTSWGIFNGNTNRDTQGFLLGWQQSTGKKWYGVGVCTNGWRPGAMVYEEDGTGNNPVGILATEQLENQIPSYGHSGAAISPVINVTSGYGLTVWSNDNNFGRIYLSMWAWSSNSITTNGQNVASTGTIDGMSDPDNFGVRPQDALYLGNAASGYDVVAVLWAKQWWGHRITFLKRNGTSFSSQHTRIMYTQYEEYIRAEDASSGTLAWDPINNKIYMFRVYWENGGYASGATWGKCDVNLNGTGTVSTSNLTSWRMYSANVNPGMRSTGLALLYNDGTNNYLAGAWNKLTSGNWYIYMRIYRNNPSTNTYTLMGSTYTVFGPGTLYSDGTERIRIEKLADTEIVDSSGNPVQTKINFLVSYCQGSGGQIVVKHYQMDPTTYGVTLFKTTTTNNYRGMLGHNYSDLTGQWFNSALLTAGRNSGNNDYYPWNSKPYNASAQTDSTTIFRVG